MLKCNIKILDEVNIKIDGLKIETRRKIANKLKYELPYARHMPAFKLGRWDGTKSFFSIGGTGYLAHLDVILPIITDAGYEIDVDDQRDTYELDFTPIDENYWASKGIVWPEDHQLAGQPVVLRDYQYEVVNKFLENPQSLQEVSTGAGKTITTATLSHLCEPYGRTMVIVPNKSLVSQTEEDYLMCGLDVGVYFGDRKELGKTHTICTWQSLNILDKKSDTVEALTLAEFTEGVAAIIVDECLDGNTFITTPTGKIKIKELTAGDIIINLDEKTKQFKEDVVVKVHENLVKATSEDMYKLEFDSGQTIEVTGNHEILTNQGWTRADQLTSEMEVIDINTYN